MNLPALCINRPVFATVMSLMLVLIGLISYDRLTVREYPNIDEPIVTVSTTYGGASAEIIESQITQPLEDSLSGIEGIQYITSVSREERSQITVTFQVDRDVDVAANDVRDRVSRARNDLPDDVDEPVIAKVEADAQPIIYLAFSSDRMSSLDVSDYVDRNVKDRLQIIPGVAEANILGERRYSMRLWLDRARLAAYNITVQDVENALRQQNIEIPAGRIESVEREYTVLSETDLRTVQQFENMILRQDSGYLVRLRDVARVELGPEDERRITRFNGESAVAIGIVKQSVANPLEVSQALRTLLPELETQLPEGMRVAIAYDSSIFIEESIKAVYHTIGEAVVLVALVVFFFLRTGRATIIPLVTIPVSLIGAMAMMYVFGFSINTLTLLAMVLAIGLVVDDAIVMLENIYRHIEMGKKPIEAAMQGSKEIVFAIVAMTITLATVYAPIGFMEGRTGRLFTEFALTLAGAVLVSGFVALTLTPMMCSRMLKHEEKHSWFYRFSENLLNGLTNAYKRSLEAVLNVRPLVIVVGLAVAGLAGWLFTQIPSELSPTEDRGNIVAIASAPEGASIEYTDRYVRQMEELANTLPEVNRVFAVVGFPQVSNGRMFIRMEDWADRDRSQQDMAAELAPKMRQIPGVMAFPTNPPSLGQRAGTKPVQVVVMSTDTYQEINALAEQIIDRVADHPSMSGIETDLKLNKPQLRVDVDRDKSADLGIDAATLGRTMETMLGGRQVTRFKREGKQYDVILQVADVDRKNPQDITNIYVRGQGGDMVPLSNLITVQESVAPRELNHFNKLRAVTITANVNDGYTLGEALAVIEKAANDVLPASAQLDYNGISREFKESSSSLYVTFVLALFFIYLVLAAQFESFRDPFIIMLTVPLSMTGALLALYFTNGTLNVYSQIGLVTLIGLITKHGILIVEFANQAQEAGKRRAEAVVDAAIQRLRPILMTTGAMVLGALPLALASGAGAESRQSIGWVIVGGLLVGTLFTLYVIPTVYTYLSSRKWTHAANTDAAPIAAE
ncbi:efflux RND transporter permease subunit [Micavibrio aeruginosavorus]|uniref:RND multidrug efflux transporter, Acriflavin resistance protein n=1 Tax=Micavibrio aeruginosavorus EPB TaxID=349215 RepID=M4VFN0_9BACT|nr:efflux RND transporter permease subunit [Micavibrio aeruginosavorus]AGH97993.1 RND multidrug efflux transporter, Acriflavin resistance protein [Micavibrio aeruginosavorus EPB]